MARFSRNYKLSIEEKKQKPSDASQFIEIAMPFTLEFDITRKILSLSNVASFRIYNLSETNRNKIRRDQYAFNDLREIVLLAGYGTENISILFKGTIQQAWSVRHGTDFITEIHCFDAGFAVVNSTTGKAFAKGTPKDLILKNLIGSMPSVKPGVIGPSFKGQILARGNTYEGSTTNLLTELTGGGFFIDNGKAHILADNEAIEGDLVVINSASGLLGTPILSENFLHFDMLFEPRLLIGQQVILESITAQNFNGIYKVISLQHKGTISGAICGTAITTVGLATGLAGLHVVPNV